MNRLASGALGLALLLAFALPGPSWGAEKMKLAVLPLNAGPGVDPKVASLVTETLVSEINERLGIKVISTQEIQAALGFERQRQLLGCTEETSCLAEIGGALGVDKIVMGTLGKLGGSLIFNLQLVDMRTSIAEKRFSKRIRNTSEEGFLDEVTEAVDALFPQSKGGARPPPTTSSERPPPPAPPQVASREPTAEAPPPAVSATAPAAGEERRFTVALRGQLSPYLQAGGPTTAALGGAIGALLEFQVIRSFSVGAGVMTSRSSTGGVIRAAWIPWNEAGALHPVVAIEGLLLAPIGPPPPGGGTQPPPALGVSLNPGVEYQPLPWLTLGAELPLTWLPQHSFAPLWIFGALTVGARF